MTAPVPPADLLHAAATRLREAAQAAGPGPWTAVPRYRKGTRTVIQYDVYKPPHPGSNIQRHRAVHPSHAAEVLYGVAVQPAVGVALADWLEAVAKRHIPQTVVQHFPDLKEYEVCEQCDLLEDEQRWPCPDIDHAVAVARAVLGNGDPT